MYDGSTSTRVRLQFTHPAITAHQLYGKHQVAQAAGRHRAADGCQTASGTSLFISHVC